MNKVIGVGGIHANISPDAFHLWATHYIKCKRDFKSPHKFSPVPYFLLCRAIELEIKARHLHKMTQKEVKRGFSHNLEKAYDALDPADKILNEGEERVLREASVIYEDKDKGFEYFNPGDALTAYKRFPDLAVLDNIANKFSESYA